LILAFAVAAACLAATAPPLAAQSLDESLVAAYESNPTLLAARARLGAVNEFVPQELSNYRPSAEAVGRAGVQRIDTNASEAENTNPLEGQLLAEQPLYRGGRTEAGVARAEADVLAQRARLDSVEQSVLLAAATAYMDVWRDQAVLKLNQNNEQVLTRELEATRDRFEVGELTRTDVAQAESRLARATAQRIQSEGDLDSSRATFEEVIGFAPGVLDEPPAPEGILGSLEEVVAAAEAANPDLQAAIFDEESAQRQVRVSFGELLPEAALTGEARYAEEFSSSDSENRRARALAEVTVPIYQQGFVSSRVRQDKQTASQRRRQIDEAGRRAERLSVDSWVQLLSAQAQSRSFESEVSSTGVALDGVRQENAVGQRTVLDVLDAEQEFLDAQVSLTRSRRDEIVAGYQVLSAMGRLTARNLELAVDVYDPEPGYRATRDLWFGLDVPED
jgi:TolC family type I secretion outer membrane protein